MCGIAGIFRGRPIDGEREARLRAGVARMQDALDSRGPDQRGSCADAESGLVLGHTRLSILDLSDAGRQPMWSACGRYAIVYNGEIYNYLEVRRALAQHGAWPGASGTDTEVLLEAIALWGCETALQRCNGMFAFALWDRDRRELILARDRFGKKPLYYQVDDGGLAFASELRALIDGTGRTPEVDPDGLGAYLACGFVPGEQSIYAGVASVAAGTFVRFAGAGAANDLEPAGGGLACRAQRYFDVFELAETMLSTGASLPGEDLDRDLEGAIRRAVVQRSHADVPVGLMLSGGIDSALVAAIAANKDRRPTAFTLGFDDPAYDETPKAAAIAEHLGLDHRVEVATAEDARATAQLCLETGDEPFADQSLIPSLMLARMVGREVKVCLSGDGGDELFGGYGRYRLFAELDYRLGLVPRVLRRAASGLASPTCGPLLRAWPKTFNGQRAFKAIRGGRGLPELGRMALTRSPMINRFVTPEARPRIAAAQAGFPSAATLAGLERIADFAEVAPLLQLLDQATYLTDDILRKTDRASMAYSVEARNPLLDRDVLGVAWRLQAMPMESAKAPLQRILGRHLPERLWRQEKRGFSPPMPAWLTGGLRDWGEAQLDQATRRLAHVLDRRQVFREWHRCQKRGMTKMQAQEFWTLIMLNGLRRA